VTYFSAVLTHSPGGWRARDMEVDESHTLGELAGALRKVALDDEPAVAVLEHEDEWFLVVRVDGDEEPRIFVSDLAAASRGGFAELVAPAGDVLLEEEDEFPPGGRSAGDGALAEDADGALAQDGDGALADDADLLIPPDEPLPPSWAGDPGLLEDLGVSAKEMCAVVENHDDDPGGALADLAAQAGFGTLLEALR
jgi:putative tRNA adenosine deaminase-associated protein